MRFCGGRGTSGRETALVSVGVLMDTWFNPIHHLVQAFTGHEIREDEWPVTAHAATVPIHHTEIRADVRSEINLIDDEQIRARNTGASLARNLVTFGTSIT